MGYYADTYRKLDKIYSYEYLSTKTPLEHLVLLISHLNDLGFQYEKKTTGTNGKEKTETVTDYPYLTRE